MEKTAEKQLFGGENHGNPMKSHENPMNIRVSKGVLQALRLKVRAHDTFCHPAHQGLLHLQELHWLRELQELFQLVQEEHLALYIACI